MTALLPARKQTVWGWPAVANFTLGGAGAGLYLLGLLLQALRGGAMPAAVQVGAPALAAAGLLTLAAEAGRPLRGLGLLRHLRRSWMSREALAAAVFIPLAALGWRLALPLLQAGAAVAAAAFLVSQGLMVYRARGVTAWNVPTMPWLFAASGLASGWGLLALLAAAGALAPGRDLTWLGLAAGALSLAAWLLYLAPAEAEFRHATRTLRRAPCWLPYPLAALALALPGAAPLAAAGVLLLAAAACHKSGIILAAGYLRAIRFPAAAHFPRPVRAAGH